MDKLNYKEAFYILVGMVTLLISIASLLVNIKNRRNGIREHLYKEQLNFIYKVMPLLSEMYFLVVVDISMGHKHVAFAQEKLGEQEVEDSANDLEKDIELLEDKYDEWDKLIDTYSFLFHYDFYQKLMNVDSCVRKMVTRAGMGNPPVTSKSPAVKKFVIAWNVFEDEVVSHVGGEILSKENRSLYREEKERSFVELKNYYDKGNSAEEYDSSLKEILADLNEEREERNK